jgi:hypothetical protein
MVAEIAVAGVRESFHSLKGKSKDIWGRLKRRRLKSAHCLGNAGSEVCVLRFGYESGVRWCPSKGNDAGDFEGVS